MATKLTRYCPTCKTTTKHVVKVNRDNVANDFKCVPCAVAAWERGEVRLTVRGRATKERD